MGAQANEVQEASMDRALYLSSQEREAEWSNEKAIDEN